MRKSYREGRVGGNHATVAAIHSTFMKPLSTEDIDHAAVVTIVPYPVKNGVIRLRREGDRLVVHIELTERKQETEQQTKDRIKEAIRFSKGYLGEGFKVLDPTLDKQRFKKVRAYSRSIHARLLASLRSRFYAVLKGRMSVDYAKGYVGCTLDELKAYLERQFDGVMSWENYGKWHIDHRKPLAKFDLNDPRQIAEAFHFTNLQPLWASDNYRKHDKTY